MFNTPISVVILLQGITTTPNVVCLNVTKSAELLEAVMSGTRAYSVELDLSKDAEYHDLSGAGKLAISGSVGRLTRINASYLNGEIPAKYVVDLFPTTGSPFKPVHILLDDLRAWDVIQTFNPRSGHISDAVIRSVSSTGLHTDNPNGTCKETLARIVTRRAEPIGYPKGTDYPNNYLGLEKPLGTKPFRISKVVYKNYLCQCCGNIQSISTNHEGSCWAFCDACSWKVSAYGDKFYMNRLRPFIPYQLAVIVLEKGVEKGLQYYEYLNTENELETN